MKVDFDELQPTLSQSSQGVRQKETPFLNVSGGDLSNAVSLVRIEKVSTKLQLFEDDSKLEKSGSDLISRSDRVGLSLLFMPAAPPCPAGLVLVYINSLCKI